MSGSLLAMPMLVINMGGEMVYILEQRLRAQNIPGDKSRKVLSDVVKTMYSKKFIAELFKPQPLYSNRSTRQIFDRLAHSSIMRLNENSMDKLYDLMTMGFKYQMICCATPVHLMQLTLNHLESLIAIVDNAPVAELIEGAKALVTSTYGRLSIGEYFSLKHTLCRFFQDRRVKVSLFLQDGTQNMDGTIVLDPTGPLPVGTDAPGRVVYRYDSVSTGDLRELHIEGTLPPLTGSPYDSATRPCKLGLNMYAKDRSKRGPKKQPVRLKRGGSKLMTAPPSEAKEDTTGGDESKSAPSGSATAGLNLLASLIGAEDSSKAAGGGGGSTFKIKNLFAEDIFSSESKGGDAEATVITIDATDRRTMQDMLSKLDLGDDDAGARGGGKEAEEDEDDLLSLMDAAG